MRQPWSGNSYRLLYFSPRPEDGEQICVAILLNEAGKWSVEYDEKLTKMKSLARDRDLEFVRATLESVRSGLAYLGAKDFVSLSASIEPQFRLSQPRPLLVPVTDQVRDQLTKRFLRRLPIHRPQFEREGEHRFQEKLGSLVAEAVPTAKGLLESRLKASDLIGERLARDLRIHRPISQALRGRTRAVLIDGVDTGSGPSVDVISRANRVGYTFWQYGKVCGMRDLPANAPTKIIRVGVVFDGVPRAVELREYSLHQFSKDCDIAIEADTGKGITDLRDRIEETMRDLTL